MSSSLAAITIHITGTLQGVGFRPFVYRLAEQYRLCGWVRPTPQGMNILVEGSEDALKGFLDNLREQAPPLAHLDILEVASIPPRGFAHFEIIASSPTPETYQVVPPDIRICPDCLQELFDPANRRYRYPFISCAHCGPRYTIMQPVEHAKHIAEAFPMCSTCEAEYHNPESRRFHAPLTSCPDCGPKVWLEIPQLGSDSPALEGEDAVQEARRLLASGKILAIKGLGGFHLACDATNQEAVDLLRSRKQCQEKPFAVMVNNLVEAEKHAVVGQAAREWMASAEHPILILERRPESPIAPGVALKHNTLGIMLPSTPLQHLLLEPAPGQPSALVMTSGNLSGKSPVKDNQEARQRLSSLADALLLHGQDIHVRCEDSVVRIFQGHTYPLRRARGYVPTPLILPHKGEHLLATGSEHNNTFCLTRERHAFLSQPTGNIGDSATLQSYEQDIAHMEHLFRIHPQALACDLYSNALLRRYAEERAARESLPLINVQHHHAHLAACMAENHIPPGEPVIGAIFDGSGYGSDGAIWGGEILLGTYQSFERLYHLDYIPLPGGDQPGQQSWRLVLAWLERAEIPWTQDLPPVKHALTQHPQALLTLQRQLEQEINTPPTSSVGRLFDAMASLLDVRHESTCQDQTVLELEASAANQEFGMYPMLITNGLLDPILMIRRMVEDLRRDIPKAVIAARFHNTMAMTVYEVARRIRTMHGIRRVALSGSVWQNTVLLGRTAEMLRNDDFEVLIHRHVPANDGGVAFGQAVVARQHLAKG